MRMRAITCKVTKFFAYMQILLTRRVRASVMHSHEMPRQRFFFEKIFIKFVYSK